MLNSFLTLVDRYVALLRFIFFFYASLTSGIYHHMLASPVNESKGAAYQLMCLRLIHTVEESAIFA